MDPKHKQGPRLRGPLSCRKGRECIVLGAGAERRGRGGKGGGGEGRRRQTRIKKDRFTFMLGMI